LDISQLSLETVYPFVQEHKRTAANEMKKIVEGISKEAMHSGKFNIDEKTLNLFSHAFVALDMGSPPSFVLNTLLLKLLAKKKR
jgi:DNA polymerase-3 subunit delta'